MEEFVGLRTETWSYLMGNGSEPIKAKGKHICTEQMHSKYAKVRC